jgi:hypothetical protein
MMGQTLENRGEWVAGALTLAIFGAKKRQDLLQV